MACTAWVRVIEDGNEAEIYRRSFPLRNKALMGLLVKSLGLDRRREYRLGISSATGLPIMVLVMRPGLDVERIW